MDSDRLFSHMQYENPISPTRIKPLSADLIKFFEAQRKKSERIVSSAVCILCTPQFPRLPRPQIAMHINAKTPQQARHTDYRWFIVQHYCVSVGYHCALQRHQTSKPLPAVL